MTVDTAKANKLLIRDCNNAPREIQRAWGRGGPQGVRLVSVALHLPFPSFFSPSVLAKAREWWLMIEGFRKRFDTWFRDDLTVRIMDLHVRFLFFPFRLLPSLKGVQSES